VPTSTRRASGIVAAVVVVLAAGFTGSTRAQELEPRAYSLSPVGTNFFVFALGWLDGAILLDPTLPIEDVHARIGLATAGYGRTFGVAGREAMITIAVPYGVAHVSGRVMEADQTVHRSGLADLRMKASINLIGGKAMTQAEFASAKRSTIFGASLSVQAPTGQYDGSKLINLGTNRWSFKPELGVSVPLQSWFFDAYVGAWFFTTNEEFYPGHSSKSQAPLTSLQLHVSYTFRNRAWLAVDGTWYGGGATTVAAMPPSARLSNSRAGATFSLPVARGHALKFAYSRGATVRAGTNFDSYVVAYQHTWFSGP
jgi:hypothetical protein